MILPAGSKIEDVLSQSQIDQFWSMVSWCASECFELVSNEVEEYRVSLAQLPLEIAVLSYTEHPMHLAADLAWANEIHSEHWLLFDAEFSQNNQKLMRGLKIYDSEIGTELTTTTGSPERALERLRKAEHSLEMALEGSEELKREKKGTITTMIVERITMYSASIIITLAHMLTVLFKFLK